MSDELSNLDCPRCGRPMEHGYIAGHWFRLRWVTKPNTRTIFAGSPMRKGIDWWSSPKVEAVRCERCKIRVFRYDY